MACVYQYNRTLIEKKLVGSVKVRRQSNLRNQTSIARAAAQEQQLRHPSARSGDSKTKSGDRDVEQMRGRNAILYGEHI